MKKMKCIALIFMALITVTACSDSDKHNSLENKLKEQQVTE